MKVERVAPKAVAASAAFILSEAWRPPCLRYSAEYLSWQLAFPGAPGALAVLASDGDEPVGFAASTPRRVRLAGRYAVVHVVSFVAVRPRWRGLRIVAALYEELLDSVREAGVTVVTFAQENSTGERSLKAAYSRAGMTLRALAPHRLFGFRQGAATAPGPLRACAENDFSNLEACIPHDDDMTLWSAPSPDEARHLVSDPRRRALLVVRTPEGVPRGAALIAHVEVVGATGDSVSTSLETVHLSHPDPTTLRALLEAASRWGSPEPASITCSGLSAVPEDVVKLAGARRLPGGFNAYLATSPGDPARGRATSLAVT